MDKLKVIMSDVPAGKFGSYIPVILRHNGHEVERIIHSVPPEHVGHLANMTKLLLENARKSSEAADLIIVPGGVDVSPKFYGQAPGKFTEEQGQLSCRDQVEEIMINTALELDIPILTICRGFQLGLLMMAKGTDSSVLQFCQHLPDVTSAIHRGDFFKEGRELIFNTHYIHELLTEDMQHGRKSPIIDEPNLVHPVKIYPGTITHMLYADILDKPTDYNEPIEIPETSHHHQGFVINNDLKMPHGLICSALSLAGDEVPILEGFENPHKSFCVGIQWHLEANASGKACNLFKTIADYALFKKINKSVKFTEWRLEQRK